jgi:hypothetical protein
MISLCCKGCGSIHPGEKRCPGEVEPTGPENTGWRMNVGTGNGIEAFAVLVAPCGTLWRARILTFPNVLWKVPGRSTTLKFIASSPRQVLEQAITFVRGHCSARGFTVRGESMLVSLTALGPGGGLVPAEPAPRKLRFLPVQFGIVRPSESGGTGNVSETGMFIITRAPIDPGHDLTLSLRPSDAPFALKGCVIWIAREVREADRPPGMGIRLVDPPRPYISYVRTLP